VAHKGAVLDVVGGGGGAPSCFFSGGLDMAVLRHDLGGGGVDVLGSHAGAVRCVERSDAHGAVVTGSWDKTVKVWDPRARGIGGGGGGGAAASLPLPDRCYAMALVGADALLVGTAGRRVLLFDLRRLSPVALAAGGPQEGALLQDRESSLKHQTRCLQALPDATGFTTGSIEGRVAVDFVDMAPAVQERKYAFKVRGGRRGGCARARAPTSRLRARFTPPYPTPLRPRSATGKRRPPGTRRSSPSMPFPSTPRWAPSPRAAATAW
jgi:cell cycle arrest protein BUB3